MVSTGVWQPPPNPKANPEDRLKFIINGFGWDFLNIFPTVPGYLLDNDQGLRGEGITKTYFENKGFWPMAILGSPFFLLDCLGGSLAQSRPTREFELNSALATSILLLA